MVQAPVAPHVIDNGIPRLPASQVLVAKYADHLPLCGQEGIFAPAGLAIPNSTLAQWLGSAGVQLQPLVDARRAPDAPGAACRRAPIGDARSGRGQDASAYLWSYCTTRYDDDTLVVFDFAKAVPADTS